MCHLIDSNDKFELEENCKLGDCCPDGWTHWHVESACYDAGVGPYKRIMRRRRYNHDACRRDGKSVETEEKTVDCHQTGNYGTGK